MLRAILGGPQDTIGTTDVNLDCAFLENNFLAVIFQCKKLTECEVYTNLIELQKTKAIRIGKELITEELKNQDCGWEDDMEPKGNGY